MLVIFSSSIFPRDFNFKRELKAVSKFTLLSFALIKPLTSSPTRILRPDKSPNVLNASLIETSSKFTEILSSGVFKVRSLENLLKSIQTD